jgi:hypothetical protein
MWISDAPVPFASPGAFLERQIISADLHEKDSRRVVTILGYPVRRIAEWG